MSYEISGGDMKPGKNTNPVHVQLPGRDLSTASQVNTILSVAGLTLSALGHFMQSPLEEPNPQNRLAGEARIAAESTFINACHTLDEILADKNRWNNSFQEKLEADYEQLHKQQQEFFETQQAASDEINTPHFRYRPTLARLVSGAFCAFLGNADDLENAICGMGRTPQEALEMFDDVFLGAELDPEVMEWLNRRTLALENGKPTESYPIKNEQEPLDTGTDSATNPPEAGGQSLPGDSPNSGPVG